MSDQYHIKSIQDCVDLIEKLPPARAAVFLRELPLAIEQQAALQRGAKDLNGIMGKLARMSFKEGFTWVDDDEGTATVSVKIGALAKAKP